MIRRLVVLATLLFVVATATAETGTASLFFLLEPNSATPGRNVTVRLGGTPPSYTQRQAVKPLQRPMRVYLVPQGSAARLAAGIRARMDPELHFVGLLVPDAAGRGSMSFTVPALDAGRYDVAAWCPGCARFSRGRTFFVQQSAKAVPRYRPRMSLRVLAPSGEGCPVTIPNGRRPPYVQPAPNHGNGMLWARLPAGGVYEVTPDRVAADGSSGDKMIWYPGAQLGGLEVLVSRLDGSDSRRMHTTSGLDLSWAARLRFPSEGCWKVTGRAEDIRLSFVVAVRHVDAP